MEENCSGKTAPGDGSLSMEETDHLECNVKKIKKSVEGESGANNHFKAIRTFKYTLLNGKNNGVRVAVIGNIHKVTLDMDEVWVEDVNMVDETMDDTILSITIDKDVRRNL
ncbi:hypothetical protein REPUB_Repub02eG0067800 [Reevesia pubescens]